LVPPFVFATAAVPEPTFIQLPFSHTQVGPGCAVVHVTPTGDGAMFELAAPGGYGTVVLAATVELAAPGNPVRYVVGAPVVGSI
jgi:hypothetical protein